jgi:hypothetical protein
MDLIFLSIDDNGRKNVPSQAAKKGVKTPFFIAEALRLLGFYGCGQLMITGVV